MMRGRGCGAGPVAVATYLGGPLVKDLNRVSCIFDQHRGPATQGFPEQVFPKRSPGLGRTGIRR